MVSKVSTDEQILAVHQVMHQLRPNISRNEFLATVKRIQETDGYQLAAVYDEGAVRAVAGYRVIEMLWCGKILYVDDLNTDERFRSKGYGKVLLDWLKNEARAQGCGQIHLDSGVQREQAHRFYFREGLTITAYHFRLEL
jgi:GNAT superfamily N-acetyltransferase